MNRLTVEWSDELATGDQVVDAHHRRFFDETRRLLLAAENGIGELVLPAFLDFLTSYAMDHFALEESHMVAVGYPHIETHKAAHRAFNNRVDEFKNDPTFAGDQLEAVRGVTEFAAQWFARHIKLVDRPFIEYLRGERRFE